MGRRGRTSEEAVKFDQKLEVDVVALRGFAVPTADVVTIEIDT